MQTYTMGFCRTAAVEVVVAAAAETAVADGLQYSVVGVGIKDEVLGNTQGR